MNDDEIERLLRGLPAPELPAAWRGEILAAARRGSRESREDRGRRPAWAPLPALRHLFARNPVTASTLAALWLLIFLFRFTTPVDRDEQAYLAHAGRTRPAHLLSLADEIRLVEAMQNPPARPERIP